MNHRRKKLFFGNGSIVGCTRTIFVVSLIGLGSCRTNPQPTSDLAVIGQAPAPEVFEGASVTLSATATGGTAPYMFRWDQNSGPIDILESTQASGTISTPALTVPGSYIFRVVVTDQTGATAEDFISVDVVGGIEADAPALAVIGEPVTLSAEATSSATQVSFEWEIISGSAIVDDPTAGITTLTAQDVGTVEVMLTATLSSAQGESTTVMRSFEIVSIESLLPRAVVETNLGDFTIELDAGTTPLHVANFLLYVDDGFYDGLLIHRVVCTPVVNTDECLPFVIQGGGFERVDGELTPVTPTRDPVGSEANGLFANAEIGSVSLALVGGDSESGTTQFFVNLSSNGMLDDQNFTAFGMVVDGMAVIDAMAETETIESTIIQGEMSLPTEDIVITRIRRAQ